MKYSSGRSHGYYGYYNNDIKRKVGKINLSPFDGTGATSARDWVQKANAYFQLNPMPEDEAIKFAALHLEGVAHERWHHGMVTLGHDQITSYVEFTERFIDRFDGRDPELNFKELAQLKQSGPVDSYITKFQRLSVLVSDISERRLVVLFMDRLMEPLKGWVKGFNPNTLSERLRRRVTWHPHLLPPRVTHMTNHP